MRVIASAIFPELIIVVVNSNKIIVFKKNIF
jgi:hypothetical protein